MRIALISAAWLALLAACDDGGGAAERTSVPDRAEGVTVAVERVVDGDTIRVTYEGRSERVRYIGVDTPETRHPSKGVEPLGPEATEANRRLVEGETVRLVLDVQERDRHGRLLAYVYLRDGTFVNAKLVEEGYAQVMTVPPNVLHQELFLDLEREARAAGRGLWALQ